MNYPYVMSPDKLEKLFKKLQEIGTPDKLDMKKLKSMGFTSSNDVRLLGAVKFVGLFDDKGVPAPLWKEFRVNPKAALAKGGQKGYADLFSQYPNAHQKDDEALRTFFSAHTDVGGNAVSKIVSTFKALCKPAKFDGIEPAAAQEEAEEIEVPPAAPARRQNGNSAQRFAESMTVNINVQLQLPPDATGDTYDKFFEAMKKHLWSPER